jgi:hypothetical protein
MGKKVYSLIWLDYNLRKSGIVGKCFSYDLSADYSCLHIVYLDKNLDRQFISVFRSSEKCYRIFYNGELISKRTSYETGEYLYNLLGDLIGRSEEYGQMTLAELRSCDNLTYNEKLNIYRRLNKKDSPGQGD